MNEQSTVGAAPGSAPAAPATTAPTEVVGAITPSQPAGQPITGTVQPGTPGTGGGGQPLPAQPAQPPSMLGMMVPLILVLVLMIVFSTMAGRKERRKRAELMANMGSGDKVSTVGGIIGTVVEIKDDEVVLRVDEVSNTRIRFAKAAVQTILRKNDKIGGGSGGSGAVTEAKMAPAKAMV